MHLNMVRAGSFLRLQLSLPAESPSRAAGALFKSADRLRQEGRPRRNISHGGLLYQEGYHCGHPAPGLRDGYSRLLSNKAAVLVNGRRAPVIGTICMDQCMIDVSNVPGEVKIGDEAVLLGRQGEEEISIEELSELICGFINYEYMVLLARRVPRVYRRGGKIVRAVNYLLGD